MSYFKNTQGGITNLKKIDNKHISYKREDYSNSLFFPNNCKCKCHCHKNNNNILNQYLNYNTEKVTQNINISKKRIIIILEEIKVQIIQYPQRIIHME